MKETGYHPPDERDSKEKVKNSKELKFHRMLIIIGKTFSQIYSLKKLIIGIVIMVFLPVIIVVFPSAVDFGQISVTQASAVIAITLCTWVFLVTYGLVFTILIGSSGASLISDEVSSGTMIILVARPISRVKIFLGKYIALCLYSALLSFLSLFIICWAAVLSYSGNIDHFIGLLPFFFAVYLYSLFIMFIFVSITLALSSIFKKSRNASLVVLFLVIFAFMGFQFIRMFVSSYYVTLQLYHFDLGYHIANVFVYFLEIFDAIPESSAWQLMFGMMTGLYGLTSTTDTDQNILLGGLEKNQYYTPIMSLLVWVLIATLLMIYGILKMMKRELSV